MARGRRGEDSARVSTRGAVTALGGAMLAATALAGCAAVPLAWTAMGELTASGAVPGPAASAAAPEWTCHTLRATDVDGAGPVSADLVTARSVVQRRLDLLLGDGATVDVLAPDSLLVGLPRGGPDIPIEAITRTGAMMLVAVPPAYDRLVVDGRPVPDGMLLDIILDDSGVIRAGVASDGMGQPTVVLELDDTAAAAFDAFAADNLGRRVAIVVEGTVRSAPVIRAPAFGGEVQVAGGFSATDARTLAAVLGGGRLPVHLAPVAAHEMAGGRCAG